MSSIDLGSAAAGGEVGSGCQPELLGAEATGAACECERACSQHAPAWGGDAVRLAGWVDSNRSRFRYGWGSAVERAVGVKTG